MVGIQYLGIMVGIQYPGIMVGYTPLSMVGYTPLSMVGYTPLGMRAGEGYTPGYESRRGVHPVVYARVGMVGIPPLGIWDSYTPWVYHTVLQCLLGRCVPS